MSDGATKCPHCGDTDCDTDCGERALIYRERQREIYRDIELDPEDLDSDGNYIPESER